MSQAVYIQHEVNSNIVLFDSITAEQLEVRPAIPLCHQQRARVA